MFSLQNYSFNKLISQNCEAFDASERALSNDEIKSIMDFLFIDFDDNQKRKARWQIKIVSSSLSMNGKFLFRNYQETFAFVSAVYLLGLEQNYYPDIMFGDGFCYITLFTIKLKGVHKNDLIMLAKIEQMIGDKKNDQNNNLEKE